MRDDSERNKLTRRRFNLMAAAALAAAPAAHLTAHAQQRGRGKGGGARPASDRVDSLRVEPTGLPAGQPRSHWEIDLQVEEAQFRIHDVPPIIVDSGSFEIGLPGDLSHPAHPVPGHPRRRMQILKDQQNSPVSFPILGVRVLVYNEVTGFNRNDLWTSTAGLEIHIWKQRLDENGVPVPGDIVGDEPDILLRNGPPFTLEIDKELQDSNSSPSVHGKVKRRKYRHDDNSSGFRLGRVEVKFSPTSYMKYLTGEREEYRICLWNELGPH